MIKLKLGLVKEVKSEIAVPLNYIFSLSLQTGEVPSNLKIAKVMPIFKSDDPNLFPNH